MVCYSYLNFLLQYHNDFSEDNPNSHSRLKVTSSATHVIFQLENSSYGFSWYGDGIMYSLSIKASHDHLFGASGNFVPLILFRLWLPCSYNTGFFTSTEAAVRYWCWFLNRVTYFQNGNGERFSIQNWGHAITVMVWDFTMGIAPFTSWFQRWVSISNVIPEDFNENVSLI